MTQQQSRRTARSAAASHLSMRRALAPHPDAGSTTTLAVDDVEALVEWCWDAGFTVRMHDGATGDASATVIDPSGRRLVLIGRSTGHQRDRAAVEETR